MNLFAPSPKAFASSYDVVQSQRAAKGIRLYAVTDFALRISARVHPVNDNGHETHKALLHCGSKDKPVPRAIILRQRSGGNIYYRTNSGCVEATMQDLRFADTEKEITIVLRCPQTLEGVPLFRPVLDRSAFVRPTKAALSCSGDENFRTKLLDAWPPEMWNKNGVATLEERACVVGGAYLKCTWTHEHVGTATKRRPRPKSSLDLCSGYVTIYVALQHRDSLELEVRGFVELQITDATPAIEQRCLELEKELLSSDQQFHVAKQAYDAGLNLKIRARGHPNAKYDEITKMYIRVQRREIGREIVLDLSLSDHGVSGLPTFVYSKTYRAWMKTHRPWISSELS